MSHGWSPVPYPWLKVLAEWDHPHRCLGMAKTLTLWTLRVRNSAGPNVNVGVPATDPPPFCFGSGWTTQVFLWNASRPASHSVHHSKYTAEALFKPRAPQGDSTFSSPAQPLLTINHTPPAAHPCGLAFCNHPSPSRSSWGSMNWSIRRLSPLNLLGPLTTSSLSAPQGF